MEVLTNIYMLLDNEVITEKMARAIVLTSCEETVKYPQ
jgi:hypothetical protein